MNQCDEAPRVHNRFIGRRAVRQCAPTARDRPAVIDERWEHFYHQADIGVRGIGPNLDAAFEQAALALVSVICDPARVDAKESVEIRCTAPNDEILFVDWINALVFEMATRTMLFSRFAVRIENGSLHATAQGEPVDTARHAPAVEVKGATLTDLCVAKKDDGQWLAQCVVDV